MKPLLIVCFLLSVSSASYSLRNGPTKYHTVTGYEIRPGVLMTANYTKTNEVCEVTLEKRHATANAVDLRSSMSREMVLQMIDELVPPAQRGKATGLLRKSDYVTYVSGQASVSIGDYENVEVQIHSNDSSCDPGDVVVFIHWKKRTCAAPKAAEAADSKTNTSEVTRSRSTTPR